MTPYIQTVPADVLSQFLNSLNLVLRSCLAQDKIDNLTLLTVKHESNQAMI